MICNWSKAKEFNKLLVKNNWKAPAAVAWAAENGLKFERKTFYVHKIHSVHPSTALVTFAQQAQAVAYPAVTQTQFYESIRDLGFKNAMEDPSTVTLTHALKAADSLERRKDQGTELIAALAKMMIGAQVRQVVTVEGDYVAVE